MRLPALFLASFAIALLATRAFIGNDSRSDRPTTAGETTFTPSSGSTAGPRAPLRSTTRQAGRPELHRGSGPLRANQLTTWQLTMLTNPAEAGQTEFLVRRAVREHLAAREERPSDCIAHAGDLGVFRLRMEVAVRSSPAQAQVLGWRLGELVDGSPLSQETVDCIESLLEQPLVVEPIGAVGFLNGFDGEIYYDLAIRVGAAEDLPDRRPADK